MPKDEFDFDVSVPVRRIGNQAILDSLAAFLREHEGKAATTIAYDRWSRRICTAATIGTRFGSWRKALAQLGASKGVQERKYDPLFLLDNLERVWRELGYPPCKRRLAQYGENISERPYVNRWGSVRQACELLARFKQGRISEEELLGKTTIARPRRVTIPLSLRWDVLKRDNYLCARCGRRPPEVELQVDHVHPVARGGTNDPGNLQTLCDQCNQGKKDRLP